VADIDDKNVNTDIETDILHMQGLKKNQDTLNMWCRAHNIKHQPGDLW